MSEQDNVKRIADAYAAFGRGDIEAIVAMCTDDVEWVIDGPNDIPLYGRRRGKDAIREFFETLARDQEAVEFQPKSFVAQGDTVVVFGFYRWRLRRNGEIVESEWAHRFTMRDGSMAKFQEYTNTNAYVEAYRKASSVSSRN